MKILANENIPLDSIRYLTSKGYDVKSVALDNLGITDEAIINMAIREERLIITFDRDYGELIFKYKKRSPKRIIYLRLDNYISIEPGIKIQYLLTDLKIETDFRLTVFNGESVRQRNY